ncbi:MAG TPA: zinc ABC transporter substrate-binding protein [Acidimicrobiia bacterium]|nr:zinc ABC transporter substrate-binding protein [Acidimicrobiia bacterium]
MNAAAALRAPRFARTLGAALVTVAVVTTACSSGDGSTDPSGGGRVEIVASFFPVAHAAERVGGDLVEVADLTPVGAEPHDLELTPADVDDVLDADLVIVLGGGFQPAVEDAAEQREGPTLVLADIVDVDVEADPHVWLDPLAYEQVAGAIRDALIDLDASAASRYRALAEEFAAEIRAVDEELATALASCERDLVVTAHDAFGRLTARYGLRVEPIAGISPEQEPDPSRLAELADLVEREGVTTVFTETLVAADVAETLAREAGVGTAVLDPLEGLSDERKADGASWASVMRENLAALSRALGCAS